MHTRALLICALLASPAWAQEHSFDLSSESVKNIVRATAATQYREVRPVDESTIERKPSFISNLANNLATEVRLDEKPPVKPAAPNPAPARRHQGPISALIDTLLDVEPDDPAADGAALRCKLLRDDSDANLIKAQWCGAD